MTLRHPVTLALACLAAMPGASMAASAGSSTRITLYRSDSPGLYAASGEGEVAEGHAVVREQRALSLQAGTQDLVIDQLPRFIDAEAVALDFSGGAEVRSQRLLVGQGSLAALAGEQVEVLGDTGQVLASGQLESARDGLLVRDKQGRSTLVRDYAAVRVAHGEIPGGARLQVRVDAPRQGSTTATLSYPTAGMGWRAAYVATLAPGEACRMRFESRASIANRSGRDWSGTQLNLVAGEPNFGQDAAPRPMMTRAFSAKAADLPEQSSLADYRMFQLPHPVDLPDASVSQVPLYASRDLACQRTALLESGGNWTPPQPMLAPDFNNGQSEQITSTLQLTAFDSLPAGYLRVLAADNEGTPQFIGEGRIPDTPKGSDATITLGTAFDLRARRERTAFKVDKAGHAMDEAFRITLTNASESMRTVTVREHPARWREWTLASASQKPTRRTTDTLEFQIRVPANGKATLDYAVHYHWSDEQQAR